MENVSWNMISTVSPVKNIFFLFGHWTGLNATYSHVFTPLRWGILKHAKGDLMTRYLHCVRHLYRVMKEGRREPCERNQSPSSGAIWNKSRKTSPLFAKTSTVIGLIQPLLSDSWIAAVNHWTLSLQTLWRKLHMCSSSFENVTHQRTEHCSKSSVFY